jgi:hypothetical protein
MRVNPRLKGNRGHRGHREIEEQPQISQIRTDLLFNSVNPCKSVSKKELVALAFLLAAATDARTCGYASAGVTRRSSRAK